MNNVYNHYFDPEYHFKKEGQIKEIKQLGLYTGLALMCQIILQNIMSIFITFSGLDARYLSDGAFRNAVDIILISASMLVPFYFAGRKMKEISCVEDPLNLNKPVSSFAFVLAVFAGLGFCMMANIVTSYFTIIISLFGVELTSPDIAMPGGTLGITTSIIRIVAIAAVVEELTLRGYVMGNLRKYGDKFAILASAVVFALMHGNMVQAPFALIAGFALGYLSVKTDTIWTGIAIHAANNFVSTLVSYAMDYLPEETVNILYTFTVYGFIILGLIAMYFFKRETAEVQIREDYLMISMKEKMKAFFINPAMIIALGYMLYITMQYIGLTI